MEAHCSVVTLMELSGSGVLVVTRDKKKKMQKKTTDECYRFFRKFSCFKFLQFSRLSVLY